MIGKGPCGLHPVRPPSLLRRLFQFRLRTLVLAVFVFSLALGWYVRRVERQREVVVAIRQSGGAVNYEYELVGHENDIFDFRIVSDVKNASDVWWVPESLQSRLGDDYFHGIEYAELQPGKTFDKAVLSRLADLPQLRLLVVEGLDDRDMEAVGRLAHLRGLVITKASAVTDAGIAKLAGMRKLEMIALHGGPRITDSSLATLASLPKLTTLGIACDISSATRIGPEGLTHVAQMTQLRNLRLDTQPELFVNHDLTELRDMTKLEQLMLCGFDISEAGIDSLEQLKNLKELHLVDSTHPDTSRLKHALPGCSVNP